ncbi:MAG: hypothetical protein HZC51_06395 [Nitrospirae bacterium]|nr:hypothetical protein [Nitrospirota bacterium]
MNKQSKMHMISNLLEAREEIDAIIKELAGKPEHGEGGLSVRFAHIYHHINFAWNIRNIKLNKEDRIAVCSEEDFNDWRQFPQDMVEWLSEKP